VGGAPEEGSGGGPAGAGGVLVANAGGAQSGAGGAAPELGPATVWLAGDSTVANGNTPCPVGWGKSFDSLFDERITVVNSAVGGRSVRTWLYDVKDTKDGEGECVLGETNGALTIQQRWQDMLRDMKQGDFLLIQFGINDGDRNCPRHVGTDAFRASYRMMAEAALERGAQPIFLTPVSAIACSGSTAVGSRGFLDAVHNEGAALSVPVIDLHEKSIGLYNELQFCPVAGGDVSASTTGPVGAFFCDDHTHFDTPGALEIAKLVAQGLTETGVTLAGYLQ
jgi:lysophospholipase L1-like esterase